MSGRRDIPLSRPGEDPYKLPAIARDVDWVVLASDMLLQMEPNLEADTFRRVSERRLFTMTETDAFDETKRRYWIVRAAPETSYTSKLLLDFDIAISDFNTMPEGFCLFICFRDQTLRDQIETTPLGHRVRVISEGSLLRTTLDFGQYVDSLVRRFEQRRIPGTEYTLRDCFVPPRAREVEEGDGTTNHRQEVDLLVELDSWASKPGVDHISIIGEYGQGKSTVVLAYCARWARQWRHGDKSQKIPLLIELRGKSPRRQSQEAFLSEWGSRFGLRGAALLNLVKSGAAVLIFEGFDEVQDAGMRFDRFEQFKSLWSFSYPGSKIIFTGRPNFFLDTKERRQLLRNSAEATLSGLMNSRILSLAFLNLSEMRVALQNVPTKVREEILNQCTVDPSFAGIASRPSMLPVIGELWSKGQISLSEAGQLTSASIIKLFIDFLYGRKEADLDRLGEYQLLHRDVRHFFTRRVALKMVVDGLRNTIDQTRFNSAVDVGFADLDEAFRLEAEADPKVADSIRRMKAQYKDRPEAELRAAIATDVRTNGLFAPDQAGGRDNLYFPHKQYFEFTLGDVLAQYIDETDRGKTPTTSMNIIAKCIDQEPACLFFASGLLKNEFHPRRTLIDNIALSVLSSTLSLRSGLQRLCSVKSVVAVFSKKQNHELVTSLDKLRKEAESLCPPQYRMISDLELGELPPLNVILAGVVAYVPLTTAYLYTRSSFLDVHVTRTVSEAEKILTSPLHGAVWLEFFQQRTVLLPLIFAFLVAPGLAMLHTWPRSAGFKTRNSYFFLEIYRFGHVRAAARDYDDLRNAAILIVAERALPPQAVPFRRDLVKEAEAKLSGSLK